MRIRKLFAAAMIAMLSLTAVACSAEGNVDGEGEGVEVEGGVEGEGEGD